jgi:hypothetical protein
MQDVLRELDSLLAESQAAKQASAGEATASLQLQNLSLTSDCPPAAASSTSANSNSPTSCTALDPVASQDTMQHASGPLEDDAQGHLHANMHAPNSPPKSQRISNVGRQDGATARVKGRSTENADDGDDYDSVGDDDHDDDDEDNEDDDEDEWDSVLDFQPQALSDQEANRVVAATSVLQSTFATIKSACLSPSVHAVTHHRGTNRKSLSHVVALALFFV